MDVFWKSSKTKARLANHITIGFDKRGWNIHETVYSTNITSKNLYYIIKKNSEIYYNIIRKGQFIKPVLKEMKSVLNTESIWNEIVCGTNVNNFGSKVAIKKVKVKIKKVKVKIKKVKVKVKKVKVKVKKRLPKLKNVLLSIKKLKLKKDELAVYRINVNKLFQNKVIKSSDKNVLFIHTKKFTYIIINIHYEPEDLDEYIKVF